MVVDKAEFTTRRLLNSAIAGNVDAEAALIARYQVRLIALAANRLPTDTRKRVDPDDVVQSACRIFIDRVRQGELSIEVHGDLWQQLVAITLNKIRSLVRKHRAVKRSVLTEQAFMSDVLVSREPTPDEALMLVETIEELLLAMPKEKHKRAITLRLQGESTGDIAREIELSVERVRQIFRWARTILEGSAEDCS